MASGKIINFAPGPAKIPEEVMKIAQKELLNYNNTGVSVMELSHRSPDFNRIVDATIDSIRDILSIPDNYRVLFLQGGGYGEFAAVPMNLIARNPSKTADYIVTGSWSAKAAKEAEKYGTVNLVLPPTKSYTTIPDISTWKLNPDASYVYYCANETVHGVEFQNVPVIEDVPLVCDMSSNILTRDFDITKFGLVYAGAQKNIGCAGVTIVIIREDLIGFSIKECPSVLDYKIQDGMNSLYNTPPTYSIYIMGLVFKWIKSQGGVHEMETRSKLKSKIIYNLAERMSDFYFCSVEKPFRSRVNATMRIGSPTGNEELEKQFLTKAAEEGMIQLKGHRSVGGIRISMYNAITIEEVERLASFMERFYSKNISSLKDEL